MNNNRKRVNKGIIVLNKGERIAVISLLSIIVILLGFSIFRPAIKLTKDERMAFHNLDSLLAIQEQIKQEQQQTQEEPVTGTVSEQKKSTSTPKQKSRSKPSKPTEKPSEKPIAVERKKIPVLDINAADSTEFVELPQIGETMASRIHRYRNRLGGFVSMDQLFEIKGMDTARFSAIKPYILLGNNEIRKINVNQDEFKTLLRHPYLEYEQVKAIVNHRERKGLIKNWEQLKGIVGEVNPTLEAYVSY
jgi:DNA uptake protein ComE-like DNA-binding protein